MKRIAWVFIYMVVFFGAWAAIRLTYDFNLTGFALLDDEVRKDFESYSVLYASDKEYVTVLFFRSEGFQEYEDFVSLEQAALLLNVLDSSLVIERMTQIDFPSFNGFFVENQLFLDLSDTAQAKKRIKNLLGFKDITEKFLSEDKKYAAIYFERHEGFDDEIYQKYENKVSSMTSIERVIPLDFNYLNQQQKRESAWSNLFISIGSVLLVFITTWWILESLRNAIWLISFVLLNVSGTLIFAWVANITMNVLTLSIPVLIVILSFSDLFHVLYHAASEKESSGDRKKGILKKIGGPLLLTSLTNLLGFAIFFGIDQSPQLRDLAMLSIFGILLSYLSTRFVALGMIESTERSKGLRMHKMEERLQRLMLALNGKRSFVLIAFLLVVVVVSMFTFRLNFDFHYYAEKDESVIHQTIKKYDQSMTGIRNVEVVIETDSLGFFSDSMMNFTDKVEDFLLAEYGCNTVFSFNTVLKRYERFQKMGRSKAYKLPKSIQSIPIEDLLAKKEQLGISQVVSEDFTKMRIIGNMADIGSSAALERNVALQAFLREETPPHINATLYGSSFLLDTSVLQVERKLSLGILLALLVSSLLIAVFLRSFIAGLFNFLVNALPLMFCALLFQLSGSDVDLSVMFILTLLFGIVMDDSLYLLSRQSKKKESDSEWHLAPLLITSLIMSLAGISLGLSPFYFYQSLAWILPVSLIFAFLLDLAILPIIINHKKAANK